MQAKHTITSDDVRCPKCYYNTSDWDEEIIDVWFTDTFVCENCSTKFECKTKTIIICTEVPND